MISSRLVQDSNTKKPLPALTLPALHTLPSCGKSHCVAVAAAVGEAISWATDKKDGSRFGQLGWGDRFADEPYIVGKVDKVGVAAKAAAGDHHSAFIDTRGRLFTCGVDRWEQLGRGAVLWKKGAVWQREPKPVPALSDVRVVDVACGADHTIALDAENKVWAWGRGDHGQLFGASSRPFTSPPTPSKQLSPAVAIAARGNASCSLDAARVQRCVGDCKHVLM